MEFGPAFWLILLTAGVVALGFALAYAIRNNRKRSDAEKALTAAATRREYADENRDRS